MYDGLNYSKVQVNLVKRKLQKAKQQQQKIITLYILVIVFSRRHIIFIQSPKDLNIKIIQIVLVFMFGAFICALFVLSFNFRDSSSHYDHYDQIQRNC